MESTKKAKTPVYVSSVAGRTSLVCLAASNAGALLAAAALVLVLQPQDRISIRRGSALTALGMVYFVTLFELLNAWALCTTRGTRLRNKYHLAVGEVLDITNKVVSAVQAVFCVMTGAIVCAWSCSRDFLRASHFMSEAYAWFGAAYFFYDIWSMYMVHVYMTTKRDYFSPREKKREESDTSLSAGDGKDAKKAPTFWEYCHYEPMILFHHLFIGGFGFLVIVYLRGGLGDCIFSYMYLMELSTPLVSLRGILSRLGLKASRAYVINGLAMLATFGICRVCSIPYLCYHYSKIVGKPYFEAINSLPWGCKVSILLLLVPQVYWFGLMATGAVRVLRAQTLAQRKANS